MAPITATTAMARPKKALTHRMPPTIEVIRFVNSTGGGLTVGYSCCWRWMLWFIAWVIGPPIQNGSVRAYTPSSTYQPATASCRGRVHDVASREVRPIDWYCGGTHARPVGNHAVPFHRVRPSGESVVIHCRPSQ